MTLLIDYGFVTNWVRKYNIVLTNTPIYRTLYQSGAHCDVISN